MDISLEQQYLKDMEIIREELEPLMLSLEEKEVDIFSVTMFFSSYLKELLKTIENKKQREVILRNLLDENYDEKV